MLFFREHIYSSSNSPFNTTIQALQGTFATQGVTFKRNFSYKTTGSIKYSDELRSPATVMAGARRNT
uniref:Uncharacterized protein n=1 Tax=Physcomitrium patens TaxID=3218 RepID=A0A2K1KTB6_PHYPA|nr:hypothetical protein PHYPA_004015 [Physcomitrium patens]